jgi:hypothetical protein
MNTSGRQAEPGPAPPAWRTRLLALGGLAALGVLIWAVFLSTQKGPQPPEPATSPPPSNPMAMSTPFTWPGVRQPPTLSAAVASLADDDPVIGVCARGQARAYSVRALSAITGLLVIVVLIFGPVSFNYCARSRCCMVFTGPERGAPLDLDQGGLRQDRLLLRRGGVFYYQDSGETLAPGGGAVLPYGAYPFERTTWKAWREAHPDTDVYVGVGPSEARGSAPGGSEKGSVPPP